MGRYELEPDKEMDRQDRSRRLKSPPPMDNRSRRRDSPNMMMQSSRQTSMPRDSYNEPYMRPKSEREHVAYKILCVGKCLMRKTTFSSLFMLINNC